jgi:hypothetical protein
MNCNFAFTPPPNTQIRIYKGNKVSKRKFVYLGIKEKEKL